ncbi:hypothetical protein EON77_11245 [bacterium]|nr:MAG: hypothetical protein EON77_11245 [bacterium]
MQMGFLNYTLGCGLMLLVVALHLGMRERGTGKYLAAMVPAAIVLFLCHLVGFVLAMLTISALELFASGATWRARGATIGRVVAIAIVPAILFKLSPTSGRIAVYDASSLAIKARAIAMTLTVGDRATDLVFLVGFAAVVGLAWRAGYRIGRAALAALAVAVGLFLVAPFGLGSQNLDTRLPFAIVLLALGLASARALRPGRELAYALIVVIVLHAGLFARVQMRRGVALDRLRAQIDALPPRALLFVGTDTDAPVWRFSEWEPPLPHAHAVAVLDGERFSSGLFAIPGQQPMALRPELESLYYYQAAPGLAPDRCASEIATLLAKLPRDVAGDLAMRPRFLIMVGPESPVIERGLPVVAEGHRYAIYRLVAR